MTRIVVFVLTALLLFSCNSKRNDKGKPTITVSILPQKTFVEKISGNDFEVNVLLPPGTSPASYTLIPSQLKSITRSKVWFRIGYIGFEYSWKEKIEQLNPNMKVVDLSEGLDLIHADNQLQSNQKSGNGVNPHTWMSPALVKQMAGKITKELFLLNPSKQQVYKHNYNEFVKEIDQLDTKIASALKNYKGRQFITFHPSLSYYAREYGLIEHSLEPGGKEPTPKRMARTMELAKKENLRVIYIQSDLDRENARVFAEETNGEIVEMWPLNPEWSENLMEITRLLIDNF